MSPQLSQPSFGAAMRLLSSGPAAKYSTAISKKMMKKMKTLDAADRLIVIGARD